MGAQTGAATVPLLVRARSERHARAYRYTGFGEQPVGPVGRQAVLVCDDGTEHRCGHAHQNAETLRRCASALSVRLHNEGTIRWASDKASA
jgi:hypothetical protein